MTVEWDHDPAADFSQLKSYAWLPGPARVPDAPEEYQSLLQSRITKAVESTLEGKGYQKSSGEGPDFFVTFQSGVQKKIQVRSQGRGYRRYGHRYVEVREYEVGALFIDIVDPKERELIWRGSAQEVIQRGRSAEQRTQKIDEAVNRILERFPPPS